MIRALAVLLASLIMQTATTAAYAADPPPQIMPIDEAALQVNLEVQLWEVRRKGCSRLLPENAAGIGAVYLYWLSQNRAPIMGMLAFAEHAKMSAAVWSVIDKGLGDGVEEEAQRYNLAPKDFCVKLFSSLKSGDFDIARSYADVDQVLARYLATHPLSVQAARAYDNPLGCMKSASNKQVAFDSAVPMCRCLWEATNSEFSAAEWTEYEAAVGGDNAQERVQALPQYKRVKPKLEACAKLSAN